MRIVHRWLAELVDVPDDVERVASEISLRGFEVAGVENGVIDFEITANRPDCLSHAGIAREASVIWRAPLKVTDVDVHWGDAIPVTIEDALLCPRYAAMVCDCARLPSDQSKRAHARSFAVSS